jgi:hypothetical protein
VKFLDGYSVRGQLCHQSIVGKVTAVLDIPNNRTGQNEEPPVLARQFCEQQILLGIGQVVEALDRGDDVEARQRYIKKIRRDEACVGQMSGFGSFDRDLAYVNTHY